MIAQMVLLLLGAYLLGSIPSAYIVTQLVIGKDIRTLGNGNAGAKNTFESVSKMAGITVFFLDILKGVLAVAIPRSLALADDVLFVTGACAILGHDFSLFLRFKGGQGMATTVGVFSVLFPYITALGFTVFVCLLALTQNWDLSCCIGFVVLEIVLWISDYPIKYVLYTIVILPLIWISHFLQVLERRHPAPKNP